MFPLALLGGIALITHATIFLITAGTNTPFAETHRLSGLRIRRWLANGVDPFAEFFVRPVEIRPEIQPDPVFPVTRLVQSDRHPGEDACEGLSLA
jgi:hypothetical protein